MAQPIKSALSTPAILAPATLQSEASLRETPFRRQHPSTSSLLILGVCSDGLPYMLDLAKPEAGSILVVGDPSCGKTSLLQAVLGSAAQLNPVSSLQFVVISSDHVSWSHFIRRREIRPYSLGLYHPFEQDAGRLMLDLAYLAAYRCAGRDWAGRLETILIIIDELTPLTAQDFEVQTAIHSLFDQGPQARIWPIVSLKTEDALALPFWTIPFRTRILGRITDRRSASRLALNPAVGLENLRPGEQFQIWFNNDWTDVWILPVE